MIVQGGNMQQYIDNPPPTVVPKTSNNSSMQQYVDISQSTSQATPRAASPTGNTMYDQGVRDMQGYIDGERGHSSNSSHIVNSHSAPKKPTPKIPQWKVTDLFK
jgi:hypothetical protein